MPRTSVLFLALFSTTLRASSGGVQFVRVWPDWKEAASFTSISEYFTGRETTGGWKVMRTHPDARAGYYFVARVKNPGTTVTGAQFVLRVITPNSADPKTYTFPANIPKGSHVFEVGLTGSDWAGKTAHPVAWKIELDGPDGAPLAAKASFLWEKPPG